MIKRVFKSVDSGLFLMLLYVIIGIVIALLICSVKVKAAERSDNFLQNIKYLPSYVQAYNWSGSNSYKSISSVKYTFGDLYPNLFNNSDDRLLYPVFNSGSVVYSIAGPLGDNGRSFVFDLPTRISKQMYTAVTTYICYSGGNMPNVSRIGAGDSYATALTTSPKYGSTNKLYFSPLTFSPNGTSLTVYCGAYFSIIQPNEQSASFHIRMDGVNNSNIVYFLMGIDVQSLGNADNLTASQVENIVKNSGLATATSVQEVNSAVQKVQEETKKVNDSITNDDVDDTNGKSFFDNFSTSDNGGISSLVTAPLKFINRATDKCSPITIPFYEKNITLQCGDTLFWNKSEVKPLRDVLNYITGGVFIYFLLGKIFKIIQNIKNPLSDSESEVPIIDL